MPNDIIHHVPYIIHHVPNEVGQQTILNILGWEPLKQQRVKAKAKRLFKTLNNMGPNSLKELFTFKTEILNHNLRDVCTMELLSGTPYHNI